MVSFYHAKSFKNDPADNFIAGTNLAFQVLLLTRGRTTLKSKIVPIANLVTKPIGFAKGRDECVSVKRTAIFFSIAWLTG